MWKSGDKQDRLEYVQAQKAKLGPGLDRILNLSYKHVVVKGHHKKADPGYLEFNEFRRERDANPITGTSPGDMKWSISEFLKLADEDPGDALFAKRRAKVEATLAQVIADQKADEEKAREQL